MYLCDLLSIAVVNTEFLSKGSTELVKMIFIQQPHIYVVAIRQPSLPNLL